MNNKSPLLVALYLPQYYETEYNNEWWGKGYTEWTACRQAKPLFKGHTQPKSPLNGNYYDLSQKENIRWQIDLAKKYKIDGFAIYQYYSCGKKLLDVPTEIIRDNPDLDIPFFLFWANESWQKKWFGQDSTVVWEQKYGSSEDWLNHFNYCLSYFLDKRYIRINDMPVYAIYNAWAFQEIDKFIDLWNEEAKKNGFKGIYFIKCMGRRDSKSIGKFSSIVTREPNYSFAFNENIFEKTIRVSRSKIVEFLNKNILIPKGKGIVNLKVSYDKMWKKILAQDANSQTCLGAFTDWDNSPRRGYNSIIMLGGTPKKFGMYMNKLWNKAIECESPMIVINAWNEWAEGAYLEPDNLNGYAYLEEISKLK